MSRTFRNPKMLWFEGYPEWEKTRDQKRWEKPPKWFKKMNRRIERAKEKDALKHDEDIPKFKKYDTWIWN